MFSSRLRQQTRILREITTKLLDRIEQIEHRETVVATALPPAEHGPAGDPAAKACLSVLGLRKTTAELILKAHKLAD